MSLTFDPAKCPKCGAAPEGTIDQLKGLAVLDEPNEDGSFDYSGTTQVWWNDQCTITDKKGRVALMCENNHEWFAKKDGE